VCAINTLILSHSCTPSKLAAVWCHPWQWEIREQIWNVSLTSLFGGWGSSQKQDDVRGRWGLTQSSLMTQTHRLTSVSTAGVLYSR